jgi:hypothetical protein
MKVQVLAMEVVEDHLLEGEGEGKEKGEGKGEGVVEEGGQVPEGDLVQGLGFECDVMFHL